MISRQRKEEIVSLFERKIMGPGSTQEISEISKEELEQTLVRLRYRDGNADLRRAVNDEIYQRKAQQHQKWLAIIIIMLLVGMTVFFGISP